MRTTHAAVIVALCTASACEKDPRSSEPSPEPIVVAAPKTAPAPPKPEPPKPAISARAEALTADVEAPVQSPPPPAPSPPPPVATGDMPVPPSAEPKAYAAWFKDLPGPQQRQITKYCKKHRTDFTMTCGGIGPLHVPYPPYVRARVKGEGDGLVSFFSSVEDWNGSLSGAQRRYVAHECRDAAENWDSSDLCGDFTPLVVAFDNQPIEFTRGASFAFHGAPMATDWPTAVTPWIAFDANGDGVIDRGAELFGSDTVLPGGDTAVNGFAALAPLDANHDGVIDASDPMFAT
ncbi:MAG: hypothetical protein ABI175_20500, partial [Polyangiales bacterium]